MNNAKVVERLSSKEQTNASEVSDQQTAYTNEDAAKRPHKKFKQNWRINLLSMPKGPRGKYTYPEDVFDSGVAPGALKCELTDRIDQMSRPPVRTLVVNKRQYKPLHKEYEDRMDRKIDSSWNTMYMAYKKARRDLSRKNSTTSKRSRRSRGSRGRSPSSKPSKTGKDQKAGKGGKKGKDKGGKGDGKKGKDKKGKKEKEQKSKGGDKYAEKSDEEIEKELEEWCELRAKPKKIFRPDPIVRGPIADLIELHDKIIELATPKKVYDVEVKDPTKIHEAALTYSPTDRILELAKPPPWRTAKEEPYIPGAVKPEALQAIITERVKQLATPKVAQNAKDTDVKEDPFAISPNALKYVATERIKELATPIDR